MKVMETGKSNRNYYIISFLASFLLAGVCIIYIMIKEGGLFSLTLDFNMQQIPFNMLSNEAVKSGQIFWNWNIDLGSNFLAAMGFYVLGSPFFWLTFPFPADTFPYLVGFMLMLKYGVAGAASYGYLQRFSKDKRYAVLASLLYAFSGFQSANMMFYHFHDVVALFPFLLIGLEKLMCEKKRGCLAIAAFFNALLNYYFFIGEVIFLVIYYFFRFFLPAVQESNRYHVVRNDAGNSFHRFCTAAKELITPIIACLWEGLLGTMMSAVLFIPSIMSITGNYRATDYIKIMDGISFETWEYLRIFEGFFFPAEILNELSAVTNNDYSNGAAYLPMIGMLCAVIYVYHFLKKKNRDWLGKLLLALLVFVMVPIFNSTFYMLNQSGYRRWYYMAVLMLALASMRVLEERTEYSRIPGDNNENKRNGFRLPVVLTFGAMLCFVLYLVAVPKVLKQIIPVNKPLIFSLILFMGFAGVVLTWFLLVRIREEKKFFQLISVGIALFCVGTTLFNMVLYRASYHMTARQVYEDTVVSVKGLEQDTSAWRYVFVDETDNYKNKLMTVGEPNLRSFCSTVNSSIMEFYNSMGMSRTVTSRPGPVGTEELLSVRYYISYLNPEKLAESLKAGESRELVQELTNDSYTYYVYQDQNALPLGFSYDYYMTNEQYKKLPDSRKALGMLAALVVNREEDLTAVSSVLSPIPEQLYQELSVEETEGEESEEENISPEAVLKQRLVQERGKASSVSFFRGTDFFESVIVADSDGYAYFGVPFDEGWTAFVNGKETKIMKVNGMMSVPVEAGESRIHFDYEVPGLKAGAAASVLGLVLLGVYVWLGKRNVKEHAQ